jgi:hypothetical protein
MAADRKGGADAVVLMVRGAQTPDKIRAIDAGR